MTKKIILAFMTISAGSLFYAQKITISNSAGADSGSITERDLYSYSKSKNPDGTVTETNGFSIGDRFQLDYSGKMLSGRGRIAVEYDKNDQSEERFIFDPSGYVCFKPVQYAGLVFGNNTFKKFVIPSAYLAASDDYTKYGRMITDSVSHDEDYNNVGGDFYIPEQSLLGAFTGGLKFGKKDKNYLNYSAGTSVNLNSSEDEKYALDFGLNYGINKVFDCGITGRNLNGGCNMKWGAFAGLKSVDNLILNGSFFYNFTSEDYLPETAVTRTDDVTGKEYYEFKKQKTLFALGISGGYRFKKPGIGIYADFISGLNSKYVANVKYYYNGELQSAGTDFTDSTGASHTSGWQIVDRGDSVKYKTKYTGKKTKYSQSADGYGEDAVPFFFNFKADYDVNKNLSCALNFKLRSMFNDYDTTWITVYPRASIKLSDYGEIGAGLRLDMDMSRSSGITGISVPLTYTYKFTKNIGKK